MNTHEVLSRTQREAVEAVEGAVLVLAGAGAGKTRTMVARMLHLIHLGTPPQRLLAVTFTNKAAGEMRERVARALAEGLKRNIVEDDTVSKTDGATQGRSLPVTGTFHALCVSILREYAHHLNLPRHFTIFDREDSLRAVKTAIKEAGEEAWLEPKIALARISREKGRGRTCADFTEQSASGGRGQDEGLARVWQRYRTLLQTEKALDFDDLLLEVLLLMQSDERVRRAIVGRFSYVHVDEYQDTNHVQHELVRELVRDHGNLFCVADIDQSIYSWRGAEPGHVLMFDKTFPGARLLVLEENYRSTGTIVEAAHEVIVKNRARLEKNATSQRETGEPISILSAYDEADEAAWIAGEAARLINKGEKPENIAVLYRANFQSRALEEAFLSAGVPYRVLGTRFFERKEVKDVLAYVRLALNRESKADLARVINTPPRGIGKVTLARLLAGETEALSRTAQGKIAEFYRTLDAVAARAEELSAAETLRFVMRASGLERHFKEKGEDERLENLSELVSLATQKYAGLAGLSSIEQLLEEAALASDQDELEEGKRAVSLMTVHAAKGLEFGAVFVTGLEDGLFPHSGFSNEERDEEEERRLMYVAMTRARDRLYLTYANVRSRFGARYATMPSEFLNDIPERLVMSVSVMPEIAL